METPNRDRGLGQRGRRAVALMVLALVAIVGASVAYLHPSFGRLSRLTAPAPAPGPPLLSNSYAAAYDFVSTAQGWALVADQGQAPRFWVFKTTDGARHWRPQFSGHSSGFGAAPLNIQFFDPLHGLIAFSSWGLVYRTADGGSHWTEVTPPRTEPGAFTFCDPAHGWFLGFLALSTGQQADFFATADGGTTWAALPAPPRFALSGKGGFVSVSFRRPSEGWTGGSEAGAVYSTIDGGLTWTAHSLPLTAGGKGGALHVPTQVRVLPGAGVMAITDELGNLVGFTSFDGGSTWRRLVPAPGETNFGSFVFVDAFHWWAIRYGTLFKSSDAGQSWKETVQLLDEWDYVPQVLDARHAWAQMLVVFPNANPPQGTGLAMTSDGGIHWTPVNVPKPV